jgi:anti-anti-sigma factor
MQGHGGCEMMPISTDGNSWHDMAERNTDSTAEMTFDLRVGDDRTAFLKIEGELDINSVDGIEGAVDRAAGTNADRLIIDVSELRFADSSAIAVWVKWASMFDEIELREPSPLLRKVIETMGLAEALHLVP